MSNDPTHPARRGICFIIAAPSGAGKSTLLRALLATEPTLSLSVSATTRAPRPGEQDGVDYHFTDRAGFDGMVAENQMLEHATVFGRSYGTPRAPVEAALARGQDVAFDVDWQGHRLIRAALPKDTISVFLLPPSLQALQARLHGRAGDSEAEIARRMAAARDEIIHWDEFDYVVVNTVLDHAVATARSILHATRSRRSRQPGLIPFIERLLASP